MSAAADAAVVALGGGHGLAASLSALRRVTTHLTAVVTVADNGGSSGRLRRELGGLPPGDLRMALAALCGDDEWGRTWADLLQHRFEGTGALAGHAVGNLLIAGLGEMLVEPVAALDLIGRLLGAHGRVLPMSTVPLDIEADVVGALPGPPGARSTVRGQVQVATTTGHVEWVRLLPASPPACPEAVEAVLAADVVVLGPGSWFTSVLPHLLLPGLADAVRDTTASRVLSLNLAPQEGETEGFSPEMHLETLVAHAPGLRLDVVLADAGLVPRPDALAAAARKLGAELVLADVVDREVPVRHDPERLAAAYGAIISGRAPTWR